MGKGFPSHILCFTNSYIYVQIIEGILKDVQADLVRKLPRKGISVSAHTAYKVHFDPHVIPFLILLKCRTGRNKKLKDLGN